MHLKVDPRFKYVARGSAPYVEWLGILENPQGKGWAAGASKWGLLKSYQKKRDGWISLDYVTRI